MKHDISLHLATAIGEAIQEHADRFQHGALKLEKVIAALGDVAAGFIAELPEPQQRNEMVKTFSSGVIQTAGWMIANKVRRPEGRQ